jgi:hypothetical protein
MNQPEPTTNTPSGSNPHQPVDDPPPRERPWNRSDWTDRHDRPLQVTVEYVLVGGADGEALQRRQNAVIREAVEWLFEHQEELLARCSGRLSGFGDATRGAAADD